MARTCSFKPFATSSLPRGKNCARAKSLTYFAGSKLKAAPRIKHTANARENAFTDFPNGAPFMKSSAGAEYKTARKIYRIKNSPLKKHAIHAANAMSAMQKYLLERGWTASMASADKSSARKNASHGVGSLKARAHCRKSPNSSKKRPRAKKPSEYAQPTISAAIKGRATAFMARNFFIAPRLNFSRGKINSAFLKSAKKSAGGKIGQYIPKIKGFLLGIFRVFRSAEKARPWRRAANFQV